MYAITGQLHTYEHGNHGVAWHGSRQIPLFYLDENVHGITDERHAVRIARQIVDPLGALNIDLYAERVS